MECHQQWWALDLSGDRPKAHQHSGITVLLGYKAGKIILSANHLMGSWGRQTPDRKVWSPGDGHLLDSNSHYRSQPLVIKHDLLEIPTCSSIFLLKKTPFIEDVQLPQLMTPGKMATSNRTRALVTPVQPWLLCSCPSVV